MINPWDPDELKTTHDHLTFLHNRVAIVDLLERELVMTLREKGCMIVILGDLDHFKRINDAYDHLVGDEILQEAARLLPVSVCSYDFVAATAAKSSSWS